MASVAENSMATVPDDRLLLLQEQLLLVSRND